MAGLRRKPRARRYPALSQEEEGKWKGPFVFILGADTQFGLKDSYSGIAEHERTWKDEIDWAKVAVKAANEMRPKPRFFVVCGDMIDAFPGTRNYDEQYRDFKTVFDELDNEIPLICVCGNHDIGNQPTVEGISKYRNSYGDDYYSFWVGGVLFITVNSQYYYNSSLKSLRDVQDTWLDKQLELAAIAKHVVIFQHIPLFVKHADEDEHYGNFPTEERSKMLKKLKNAGVRYVFAGHYHRNAGGFHGNLEMIVTSAIGFPLGDDENGIRIVTVMEEKITHEFVSLNEIPKSVEDWEGSVNF
ncbi:serine/threonine-protein phosphatase CPPED1-like isoform X2 [Xenia sp. Carnegie-2017]|uniref:serine/threonine-protein phosphatase CPPED1-like isoform X2 n=1 Tax=Xenia sp. Carnegie-2017 TaxID=2897299 RepID=UPI001F04304F|nr:serine/threonine-protein phosphatase CPPED1-like isoform X2 [Xenia sp. Carnegie-2017]